MEAMSSVWVFFDRNRKNNIGKKIEKQLCSLCICVVFSLWHDSIVGARGRNQRQKPKWLLTKPIPQLHPVIPFPAIASWSRRSWEKAHLSRHLSLLIVSTKGLLWHGRRWWQRSVVEHQGKSCCECVRAAGKSRAPQHYMFFHLSAEMMVYGLVGDGASLCYPSLKMGKAGRYFMLLLCRRWLEVLKEQKKGQAVWWHGLELGRNNKWQCHGFFCDREQNNRRVAF